MGTVLMKLRMVDMQAGVDVSKHGGHAYPGMEHLYNTVDKLDLESNMTTSIAAPDDDDIDDKFTGPQSTRGGLHGRVSLLILHS